MKNSLALSLFSATTVLLSFPVLQAEADPTNNQSFEQWCLQKDSFPVETKKTIEIMLEQAGTQDCKLADSKLNSLTRLYLRSNQISSNQISDLKPITSLTNLTYLDLGDNQISDLKPVASLTNLTDLYLSDNQISDLKPISGLMNLTVLGLSRNQISDLKPVASLTNLTYLDLSGNQISDLKPISGLKNLTSLGLRGIHISDLKLKPLAGLTKLTELYLIDNQQYFGQN